jgi:hypothetical protein
VDSHSWPCPTCADERVFEQPPCLDGHTDDGAECPEWGCVDCGTALVVAVAVAGRSVPARSAA